MIRRGSFLSNAWLVTGSSLAAIAVLVFFLWSMGHRPSVRGNLRLFCAAGMRKPVRAIIEKYEEAYGVAIQADYKGTGELMTSLGKIGVPGDLFLSADSTTMQDAVKAGLVQETMKIAVIKPVLVVNRKTQEKLEKAKKPVTKLDDLLRDDLKVVLANETAAIGRVGMTLLQAHGLWGKLEERRRGGQVLVSNVGTVNEVAQRVSMKDDFIGLVWDATAKDFPNLALIDTPELQEGTQYVEIGVLKRADNPTAALHFARYLTASDQGLKAFADHQFKIVPDGDPWEDRPTLRVAAGSMLRPGLKPVLQKFEKREGIKILTDYAGCGILVSKMHAIKGGQDASNFPDVYVSCDVPFADKVREYYEGITLILENDLVIIVPKDSTKNIQPTLEELKRTDLKIGLPHPQHSAMGARIVTALKNLDYPRESWDAKLNPRITNFPSADFLVNDIGSLDLAIVARSNALSNPLNAERLKILEIAEGLRTTQTFGIARHSRHKHLSERLLRTILAPDSLQGFRDIGFHTELKKP